MERLCYSELIKQQDIAFVDWVHDKYFGIEGGWKKYAPYNEKLFSTEDLYNEYLKQKQ